MQNFWRVVRMALRHRTRFVLAILCALVGAAFFGGNLGAVFPIMRVLLKEQTPQQAMTDAVASQQKRCDDVRRELTDLETSLAAAPLPHAPQATSRLELNSRADELKHTLTREQRKLVWYQRLNRCVTDYVPTDRFKALGLIMIALVVGLALSNLLDYLNETLVASVMELTVQDMRNQLYRQVMRSELSSFNQQRTSELMARFTNDMKSLGMGIEVLLGKVIREPVKTAVCIGIAFWFHWRLTLLTLLLIPVALAIITLISSYVRRAARRTLESMSSIYQILQESLQGIKIVKAFAMEPYERLRLYRENKRYYRKAIRLARLEALAGPATGMVAVGAVAVALLAGSYLVISQHTHIWGVRMVDGSLSIESLTLLFACLIGATDPIRKLSNVYTRIQRAAPAADRIFTFLDRKSAVAPRLAPRLPRHHRSVQFVGVHFGYVDSCPVLHDINLDVSFGETIALVGPNGCGKTTLVSLLPKFYEVQQGRILIDGVDIRDVQRRSLRRQFGIVTQETILFNDTIANNIAYGNRHAGRPEIEAAAKKAHAHRFITELPEGYETIVGEKAIKISGGQRQRIALARAILRDPAILILDEATSALDIESESLIRRVLQEFTTNRTTFLITHRLSSLQLANRIVVMNQGRIEDQGTHDELMRRCPLYARVHEIDLADRYSLTA